MKYLLVGDVHLDKYRRLEDTRTLLNYISCIAWEEKCEVVIQLGDLYETRRPHQEEMRVAERWVHSLAAIPERKGRNMRVVLLAGNHDSDGERAAIDEFRELGIKNVEVYNKPSVVDGIFLGHFGLSESAMGTYDFKSDRFMKMADLLARWPDCQLYALGDIHKPQIMSKMPLVFHTGSIDRIDFGERNEEKYVWVWDSETRELKSIRLPIRPMIQVDGVFKNGGLAWTPRQVDAKDAIVKVVVTGTPAELKKVDEAAIRGQYSMAYSLAMKYEVVKENSTAGQDKKEVTEGMSDADALKKYLSNLHLDKVTEATVLEKGREIINGKQT